MQNVLALSALLLLAGGQYGMGMRVGMAGSSGRAPTASGVVDWTRCADGSTAYPCAATEATVRPAGGTVTVTSGASVCVGSATGAAVAISANDLCAAATSGTQVFSAAEHSNILAYSGPENWTASNASCTAASASCPLWVDGVTRMALCTSSGASPSVAIDAANSRCRGVWLALATGDGALDVTMSDYSGDGPQTVAVPAAPTRVMATAAGQTGIKLAWTHSGRFCAMRGTGQNSLICDATNPAPATAGLAATGANDVAGKARSKTTDLCVGVKATPSGGWAAGINRYLWASGTDAAANSTHLRVSALNAFIFAAYDVTGTRRYVTAAASGAAEKSVIACRTATGAMRLTVDGVLTDTTADPGTGIITTEPTTIALLRDNAGTGQFNGAARCVCEGASEALVNKCFAQRCP